MLTAAVVGCGPRGAEHARALRGIPGLDLIGVVDPREERRAPLAAELDVPAVATLPELLARRAGPPSLVVLATPVTDRRPLAEAALAAGVRALVVEKPMARRLDEARELVARGERAGAVVVVGHQLRFAPEFVALKAALDRGELGQLRSLSAWCHGDVLDQGPHVLDMVCWLAGARRVRWVMAQACGEPDVLRRLAPTGWRQPAPGTGAAPPWMVHHVAFDDGVRATVETGPLHQRSGVFLNDWLQKRVQVIGSEGMAEAQAAGYFRLVRPGMAPQEVAGTLDGYEGATRAFHEELRDVLLRGGTHRGDAREALRSFELLAACAQSAADGALVPWPPDPGRDALAELATRPPPRRASGAGAVAGPPVPEPAGGTAPEFSVIVTIPDHRGHAGACVESWVRGQDLARDRYEVIVVGNGAEPQVEADLAGRLGAGDRLLSAPTPSELEMYHRGAEAARGRWLVFTESHCTAERECLSELDRYLASASCAGACLRSVSGPQPVMARLEDRVFKEGFVDWSRPGDWRKVILRGFALRRSVYLEVGGFEHRFGRFGEWALAATLHARGVVLGYAAGAAVRHFDTTCFADLWPPVADFTEGECAYRALRPEAYCERYFGAPPEWTGRHRWRREVAGEIARTAWCAAWRDGWGRDGIRFAGAMVREAVRALPAALLGGRFLAARARLGLALARLRLASGGTEARQHRAYQRLLDAMVRAARVDYLVRHPGPGPTAGPPGLQFALGEMPGDALAGFHPREGWQGHSFRWTDVVGTLWLDVPRGDYEVVVDTGGILGPALPRRVAVAWNGRRVAGVAVRREGERLRFPLAADRFAPRGPQRLTLACAPLRGTPPRERRRLGLPVVSVTFVPVAPGPAPSPGGRVAGEAVARDVAR